jgi:hypothetical protein
VIYVITCKDEKDGKTYVSHGIDSETLESVILPQEPWESFKRAECKPTPEGYVLKD